MTALKVTVKGQVTLRRDVLQHLGVAPGEKITVDKLPNGRIEVRAVEESHDISSAYGVLARKNRRHIKLSLEEINAIAAKGWKRRK